MAVSTEQSILNMLKTWYKDKVVSLLFRNSPVLKMLNTMRVEGKEQAWPAISSRGGAVAGDATVAVQTAATNFRAEEFRIEEGQLFSYFSYNNKEVLASKSRKGAYMKLAGVKAFAAAEAFRKTLASALYGRGFGEVGVVPAAASGTALSSAGVDIELTDDTIIRIDINSKLVLKSSVADSTVLAHLVVTKKDGNVVTVTSSDTYTLAGTEIIALDGSMVGTKPLLPMGLAGWLPYVNARKDGVSDTNWSSYINTPFYNVTRSINTDGLAGQFVKGISGEKKYKTIIRLIKKLRDAGSEADLIILNPDDWLEVSEEIASSNTYFTQTSTRSKREANVGFDKLSASFSTNFIDLVVDDPYCPKSVFYVLDKSTVEIWTYTHADTVIQDTIAGNNPGKQDPEDFNDKGREDDPYKLLIDDYISIAPNGVATDGESTRVAFNGYMNIVVTNPSVNGVGLFYTEVSGSEDYSHVLGYL